MESRKWKVFGAVVLLVFLVSCAGQVKPIVAIPVPVSPSATATRTPRPTKTLYPTWTPGPTATETPSIFDDKVVLSTLYPKTDAKATARAESTISPLSTLHSMGPFDCCAYSLSPTGLWASRLSNQGNLVVFKLDRTAQWNIPTYTELYGTPRGFFRIDHWSADGQYLYLFSCLYLDGLPCTNDGLLHRLDLQTGQLTKTNIDLDHSFSPDDKKVIYVDQKTQIALENLDTGEIKYIQYPTYYRAAPKFSYLWTKGFYWSPDGLQVAFSGITHHPVSSDYDTYGVFVLDVPTLTLTTKIDRSDYVACGWNAPNFINLCNQKQQESQYILDLSNNKVYSVSTRP